MRIAVVVGTRPEIIKMSPIIQAAAEAGHDVMLVHTGQHYSHEMDRVFFEDLALPAPDHHLDVGSGPHGRQTGAMLAGIEAIFGDERPDWVLVQGDTNTVLAGALVASKMHIPVGHVEAGLRSGDRSMPEELNRIVTDHLSDLLFPPTQEAVDNLRREGIPPARIVMTGNTVVDAVRRHKARALERLPQTSPYILLTAHRAENVDSPERLQGMLDGARRVAASHGLRILFPVHPRTKARLENSGIVATGMDLVPPTGYLEFLALEAGASLILSDSGGVQEEACILGVPCVTLRDNTERPETIEVGANRLAGTDPERIVAAAREALAADREWPCPFGDGHAAERILEALA